MYIIHYIKYVKYNEYRTGVFHPRSQGVNQLRAFPNSALNFTLMTFWISCNGHADSLGVKKQVDQKWSIPVVKGLKRKK